MDLKKFLSKPFKKLKHRLAERSRKRGGGSGSESDRDRREANIEGTEASQRSSRLHSEVEVAESQAPAQPLDGPNREGYPNDVKVKKVGRVDSPISPPPIPPDGGSKSIIDDTAAPDHVQEAFGLNQSEPNAAEENTFDQGKSTASVSAESLLRGVSESTDTFGPLKSVAGGLYFILENCEQTKARKQAIESLAPRVKDLSALLCMPTSQGDAEEKTRRDELQRRLEDVLQELKPLIEQGNVEGFFDSVESADKLGSLVEDIRDAMINYQTSFQQDVQDKSHQLIGDIDHVLLNAMYHASDASHFSGDRQGCLRGTRRDVFLQLEQWLKDEQDQHVFWLNGLAGTGKSTIAQTFAEICFADGNLGASFFCSRDFEDRSNLRIIFPTLAFQLAYRYPLFRRELLQVLRSSPDVGRESLVSQMEMLIADPLRVTQIQTLIIIDALDECKDMEPASAILSVLSRFVNEIPYVKFFITSRPEPGIRSGFRLASLKPITEVFKLHDVDHTSVDGDIKLFFRTQLTNLAKTRSDCDITEDWPSSSDIDILCEKAAGSFIHAAAVVKFIASKNHTPTQQLKQVISLPQNTFQKGTGINLLYTQVLEQAFDGVNGEPYSDFRAVIGAVLLVFSPLSMKALSMLITTSFSVSTIFRSLHSVLLIPNELDNPIQVFHKSFSDFLMDPKQCMDKRFYINPSVHHQEILFLCLNLMKERLERNICNLGEHTTLSEVVDIPTRRKEHIGDALEYACQFWVKHLVEIPTSGDSVEEVHEAIKEFFTNYLLFWIEVLVIMGNLNASVYAINDIQQWYISAGSVCKWTDDSQRFILEYIDTIRDSPSEIYHCALPFSPPSSWLCECYGSELPQEVKVIKGLPTQWGACSRTASFSGTPGALACWKDLIAVGFDSGNITILDAVTGIQKSVLSGHTDWVGALTFSSDGRLLVSGSDDETVILWSIQTGGAIRSFVGHTHWVRSVSISLDRSTIASGSDDKTIRLWDVETGKCHCIIDGHKNNINSVDFSPVNPQLLISASSDKTIQQWNISGKKIGATHDGSYIALSSDGSQFVSWGGKVVVVQNSDSGVVVTQLHGSSESLLCCCFSPDGKLLAGAGGYIIYIWDITSSDSYPVETFVGHTDLVTSLAFSSSLISASDDQSVKFWQISALSTGPVVTNLETIPSPSASIAFVSLQASDGIAISGDLAGMVMIWDISTGLCNKSFTTEAKTSTKRDVRLVGGRLICVWCTDDKIHTWDSEGGPLQTIDASFKNQTASLKISGDGSMAFLLDGKSIQAWSIQTGKAMGEVWLERKPRIGSLNVNGSSVLVHFGHSQTRGWDFGIPDSAPTSLPDVSPPDRPHLDFIDGTVEGTIYPPRIKDTATDKEVFRLPWRYAKPTVTEWDGRYLVAGYDSGEVLILDFDHIVPQ